jgi:hypothetical protein
MAQRSRLSIERKLQRELKHRAWLAKHLPQTAQYRACQRRILVLSTQIAEDSSHVVGVLGQVSQEFCSKRSQ